MKILFPLFIFVSILNAGITQFRAHFFSERYYVAGKFENSLTKPFYKDYENSINIFLKGFIYHRAFLIYELRNYFIWQGWNGNLKGRREKNYLQNPLDLKIRLLPKSRFPFAFSVVKENFQKKNTLVYEKNAITYSISQSVILDKLPFFNFKYSWGKYDGERKKAFSLTSNYIILKKHSLSFYYRKESPSLTPYSENMRVNYNFNIPGKMRINYFINYFFRDGYTYTNSNFVFEKIENNNYNFTLYYFLSNTKFTTSQNFRVGYKKFLSERIISNTGVFFNTNSLKQGNNYYEGIDQDFSLKFLNSPKSLTVTPGLSLFLNQNINGKGWGYTVREGNIFEHKKLLFFKTFRVFLNLYLTGLKDEWIYRNEVRSGYNLGTFFNYESARYYLSLNFYYNKNISKQNIEKNEWTKYHMRIEFQTKEIPFYLSYTNEFIRTDYGSIIRKEFVRILFKAPIKIFSWFTIDERFYFRKKFENDLKLIFYRNYGGLIFSMSIDYIYLIYPNSEQNFMFHFFIKRDIKLK